MRITNKIMQNNNLSNINTNKVYQDTLSTQMSTQKKIARPSEDPVVAIRALRLRSNVTEISQYYSKNIPDAKSWLSVTEDGLGNLTSVVTEMIKQCTRGANGDLKTSDRTIILEQLESLKKEVYSTGDADYAGRYVFTGYRTNTSLSFPTASEVNYTITEQINSSIIDQVKKVDTSKLLDWTETSFDQGDVAALNETAISSVDVYRIRLSYNNGNKDFVPEITIPKIDDAGQYVFEDDEKTMMAYDKLSDDPDIDEPQIMHSYWNDADYSSPYAYVADNDSAVVYIPETGEMLLGKNAYEKLMSLKDDPSSTVDESQIRITYQKNDWEAGDLRPEHYFYCEAEGIVYNDNYLTSNPEKQSIEYDVGFNQTIRVNSTADECFDPGIGRTTEDIVKSMQELTDIENMMNKISGKLKDATEADKPVLQAQYDAAKKAYDLAKDKSQKLFESGITAYQKYLDAANICITNCGTRSSKLELIESRMQSQKTTFETLKSENEDVDITEVAINLSSAELTYEAALMATGKISQTTLLNYI